MQHLPWRDGAFDLVAGFNSFFFAEDMVAAVREAGRVAKPGVPGVIQVWGRPERCSLEAFKYAVAQYLPPPDPNAPRGSMLWEAGVLEGIAERAGLTPASTFDTSWAYEFPDGDTLATSMLAAGGLVEVIGPAREAEARAVIAESLAAFRSDDGRYRLENEWHFLVATAQ
jgi:SAM-dependent methyltransferase